MFKLFIFVLLVTCSLNVFGQNLVDKKLIESTPVWLKGTLHLDSTTVFNGLLKYNETTGVLHFKEVETADEILIVSHKVYGFALDNNRKKYFTVALPSASEEKNYQFCELIRQFEDFAVFSNKMPLQLIERKGTRHADALMLTTYVPFSGKSSVSTKTVISQNETIYFAKNGGEAEPYLIIHERIKDRLFEDDSEIKSWITDKSIFQKFTGEHWKSIEEYAKINKFSFKNKTDLLKLLEFYYLLTQS